LLFGSRRCGVSLAGARMKLGLFVGTLAFACGAGVAVAQSEAFRTPTAHVYWSNGNSKIFEANPNGTHAKTIANRQHTPDGMAVGGGHLYWVNIGRSGGSFYSGNGKIVEANLNGTHAKTIAKLHYNWDTSHGLPIAVAVAVGNRHLYWADGNKIVEANRNGTHAKTIATGQYDPLGLAVGGGHLYWGLAGADVPTSSGVDIWSGAAVVEANLDGTGAKTIATVQNFPTSIGVGGGHLYWADGATIVEANLDGTGAKTILGSRSGFSGVLAVGGGHLYWAGTNKLVEANLDGTGATIVKHQGPAGIAFGS
jgi:hypothetical protein